MFYLKKYTNILYWIAMVGLIVWFAYTKAWILADFKSIDAKEAITLIENDDNLTILDVRTIQEYKGGHLRDAKLIPVQELTKNLSLLKDDKSKKILVYCRSGSRSVTASRILKEKGFTPINIKGGIIQLIGAKAEIVR